MEQTAEPPDSGADVAAAVEDHECVAVFECAGWPRRQRRGDGERGLGNASAGRADATVYCAIFAAVLGDIAFRLAVILRRCGYGLAAPWIYRQQRIRTVSTTTTSSSSKAYLRKRRGEIVACLRIGQFGKHRRLGYRRADGAVRFYRFAGADGLGARAAVPKKNARTINAGTQIRRAMHGSIEK